MVSADYLFLMTDVDCLYDANPRTNPNARPIEVVRDIASLDADVSSAGSSLGTGGMSTKLVAARLATSAGVTTIISRSSNPGNIVSCISYLEAASRPTTPMSSPPLPPQPPLHTRFLPNTTPIRDRHFWLLNALQPHGTIFIDTGAYLALVNKAGLLPVGVLKVEGVFAGQESVRLMVMDRPTMTVRTEIGDSGEVGRALMNYNSWEVERISGKQSDQIGTILGYADSEYVALRENVALFEGKGRGSDRPDESLEPASEVEVATDGS